MERVYYAINEESAKHSHEMMSFGDYVAGSKTAEYQVYVNLAYDLADRVAAEKPEEAERAYSLAEKYAKKMADNMNRASSIGCMCPSVMIAGPANFPVRKKEKQNAAMEKNHEDFNKAQKLLEKIANILYGREIIKSGDERAIEKLDEKLSALRAAQSKMKKANRAIRLKDIEKGNAILKDMGYTDKQIEQLREPDFCGRVGYPAYALQNNNANIHRVENRIKGLKTTKKKGTTETENQFFRAVENVEAMRLQLFFEDKPGPEVRNILKSNGFRWAPSQMAWQRQLTNNSRHAMRHVIEQMEQMNNATSED